VRQCATEAIKKAREKQINGMMKGLIQLALRQHLRTPSGELYRMGFRTKTWSQEVRRSEEREREREAGMRGEEGTGREMDGGAYSRARSSRIRPEASSSEPAGVTDGRTVHERARRQSDVALMTAVWIIAAWRSRTASRSSRPGSTPRATRCAVRAAAGARVPKTEQMSGVKVPTGATRSVYLARFNTNQILVVWESFWCRLGGVGGCPSVDDSNVVEVISAILAANNKVGTGIVSEDGGRARRCARRERTKEGFFSDGSWPPFLKVPLPGTNDFVVAAYNPAPLFAFECMVYAHGCSTAWASSWKRIGELHSHAEGNCIPEGWTVHAESEDVERCKREPRWRAPKPCLLETPSCPACQALWDLVRLCKEDGVSFAETLFAFQPSSTGIGAVLLRPGEQSLLQVRSEAPGCLKLIIRKGDGIGNAQPSMASRQPALGAMSVVSRRPPEHLGEEGSDESIFKGLKEIGGAPGWAHGISPFVHEHTPGA
jgi:hypothetical protein